MEIVKVQHYGTNTFISVPKSIREKLGLNKGDKMIMKLVDGKLIVEKCEG